MKKLLLIVASVLTVMAAGMVQGCKGCSGKSSTIVKEGAEAPSFTVKMLDGSSVTLDELRGKVVLLNFWATWCPPCRMEFTRVQEDIIDRFAGRDFVFLPVSRGEQPEVVADFMDTMGYTFPVGIDPDKKIFSLYATESIPRNFMIDKDGKVVMSSIGYTEEAFDEMIDFIEDLLK